MTSSVLIGSSAPWWWKIAAFMPVAYIAIIIISFIILIMILTNLLSIKKSLLKISKLLEGMQKDIGKTDQDTLDKLEEGYEEGLDESTG